jgi:hypothetical protein
LAGLKACATARRDMTTPWIFVLFVVPDHRQ